MREEPIIPFDSDEAAQLKTVTGWVSRDGRFWGNEEEFARHAGCTHKPCADCGILTRKTYLYCPSCTQTQRQKVYKQMEKKVWDEKTPLVLFDTGDYFFDRDSVESYAEYYNLKISELQLVICEPLFGRTIDAYDFFCDELPEDGEIPDELLDAVEDFNRAVKRVWELSWVQGTFAAEIKEVKE